MTLTTHAIAEPPWPRSDPPTLTPGAEQQELREAVRGLLAKHSGIESIREVSTSTLGFSRGLWQLLTGDMSVASLAVPEADDGLGYGTAELGIILEECGRALVCEPVLTSAVLGTQALLFGAAAEEIKPLLTQTMDGSLISTVSTLDPGRDDVHAELDSLGWVLTGSAKQVVGGDSADIVIVSAAADDGRRIFALRPDTRTRAVRDTIDPTRRLADITLDRQSAIPLTSPDDTETFRSRINDLAILALACENTGIVDRLLELTLEYVQTREQFGRPIGSFQAIKHRLADLLITLERARSASRYAAAAYADDPAEAQLAIAVAGAVCTDAALEAAAEAIQLHGGVGFTWEHPAHSYFRRALGNEALQGDSRTHRARIANLIGI